MKYLPLHSYDTQIITSKLAFGTGSNLRSLSDQEIHTLMDTYVEAGGNCFDTARGYLEGRSEEVLSSWLKSRKNRENVLVCSKAGHPGFGTDRIARLKREEIEEDLHESLKTLGTDYLDIFWIHKDDPAYPVQDVIDTINAIIQTGKVRMVGCSNWSVGRIIKANTYAKQSGQHGFLASQIQWSLAKTEEERFASMGVKVMEDEAYRWYLEKQMPVFAFSAQAMGFFAKYSQSGLAGMTDEMQFRYASDDNIQRAERLIEFAQHHKISVSQATLAYIINNAVPAVAVISSKSKAHLLESMSAAEVEMSAEEASQLYIIEH